MLLFESACTDYDGEKKMVLVLFDTMKGSISSCRFEFEALQSPNHKLNRLTTCTTFQLLIVFTIASLKYPRTESMHEKPVMKIHNCIL